MMEVATNLCVKVLMVAIGVAALIPVSVAAPRAICGNSGRMKRWARLGNTVWPQEKMPLTISVANSPRGFSISDIHEIAEKCAKMWSAPAGLSMQYPHTGSNGNIAISFKYIDGPWKTVGRGLSPRPYGDYSSYMHLDQGEHWKRSKDTPGQGVSLTWAICHEMGHNLGLGHSTNRDAIMYPAGIGQDDNRLNADDYNGITSLYRGGNSQGRPNPHPVPRPRPDPFRPQPTPGPFRPQPTPRRVTPAPNRNTRGPNYAPPGHRPNYRPGTHSRQHRG